MVINNKYHCELSVVSGYLQILSKVSSAEVPALFKNMMISQINQKLYDYQVSSSDVHIDKFNETKP
jgi:hypothetical protein